MSASSYSQRAARTLNHRGQRPQPTPAPHRRQPRCPHRNLLDATNTNMINYLVPLTGYQV